MLGFYTFNFVNATSNSCCSLSDCTGSQICSHSSCVPLYECVFQSPLNEIRSVPYKSSVVIPVDIEIVGPGGQLITTITPPELEVLLLFLNTYTNVVPLGVTDETADSTTILQLTNNDLWEVNYPLPSAAGIYALSVVSTGSYVLNPLTCTAIVIRLPKSS